MQGLAIRRAGEEYGATTGRARRVGWLDLYLLKYAMQFNGGNLVLTKLDVLDDCHSIKVCVGYKGQDNDRPKREVVTNERALRSCQPMYTEFEGWRCVTAGITSGEQLPPQLESLITFVEQHTDATVLAGSIGPTSDQTFVWNHKYRRSRKLV